jgi:probable HAF family extracellular repeat protein
LPSSPRAVRFENGKVIDLGMLPGDIFSQANSINNRGEIVGFSGSATGHTRAVIFADGKVIDLGTLPGGKVSRANAINDRGEVVGFSDDANGVDHAVLFDDDKVIDLGILPGEKSSNALGLNDRGEVVGSSNNLPTAMPTGLGGPALIPLATVFRHGKAIALGTLPGGLSRVANGVNDRGVVVGFSSARPPDTGFHAVIFVKGNVVVLPALPGIVPGTDFSNANGINDRGVIVGNSTAGNTDNRAHAVVWTPKKLRNDTSSREEEEEED